MKPLRVKIYGLFPTLYTLCSPCISNRYIDESAKSFKLRQYFEYPGWVRENNEKLIELIKELVEYFGRNIRIDVVNADSLRGLLIALRYRLKGELAVIVEGKVFKGRNLNPVVIREHVKKLLREKYFSV